MNLTIDQGNSSAKVSIFDGGNMLAAKRFDALSVNDIDEILDRWDVTAAIYSTVEGVHPEVSRLLEKRLSLCVRLDAGTPMPITIDYATPHTLGRDRIAAAAGAAAVAPGKNAIVIDAGTAVTLDVVDSAGRFKGGNISPGLRMRFEALNNFTSRLPLVSCEGELPLVGHDTTTAIRAGVVGGLVAEIESFIDKITAMAGGAVTLMTGGDSEFLASVLQREVIVAHNLVAIGLDRILTYNENL